MKTIFCMLILLAVAAPLHAQILMIDPGDTTFADFGTVARLTPSGGEYYTVISGHDSVGLFRARNVFLADSSEGRFLPLPDTIPASLQAHDAARYHMRLVQRPDCLGSWTEQRVRIRE